MRIEWRRLVGNGMACRVVRRAIARSASKPSLRDHKQRTIPACGIRLFNHALMMSKRV